MTQAVWRIATDTPFYTADDLSGAGAKATGGRWNGAGIPMLYGSDTRALACLETLVRLKAASLPFNRYLVRIDVPDDIWAAAQLASASALPVGWDAEPAGLVSIDFGSRWAAARATCLLVVPSVIVPEECNILFNPAHPDMTKLTATKVRRWLYDPRLGA